MCYVYELLNIDFSVSAYYYNPNIMPVHEYNIRYNELAGFSETKKFELLTDEPDRPEWLRRVKPYRYLGEKSPRCTECYKIRLEKTFLKAEREKFEIVASSLSISPHKNADAINCIGSSLSSEYGISFYEADFKKKDGFKKSVIMSREYGFYRQDYCGCIYSMLEKDPNSKWAQKVKAEKSKYISSVDESEYQLVDPGNELDLHHFNPADTEKIVNEFLKISAARKYSSVRIIHGKGKSKIKQRVHSILKQHPGVISFNDDSWNWGVTIIQLVQDKLQDQTSVNLADTSPSTT